MNKNLRNRIFAAIAAVFIPLYFVVCGVIAIFNPSLGGNLALYAVVIALWGACLVAVCVGIFFLCFFGIYEPFVDWLDERS